MAEVSSALSIKLRLGAISAVERAEVLAAFGRLSDRSFVVLPIHRAQFRNAARLADLTEFGLRAADALHVAIALAHGATLCTLDQRLADAAIAVGVQVETI